MEKVFFELFKIGGNILTRGHTEKVLPKDTNITKYFVFNDRIFADMTLPDGRHMVYREHVWSDDGEIMNFGFEYSDGIPREGFNPLHIVKLYSEPVTQEELEHDLLDFLKKYECTASNCAERGEQ